MSARAMQDAKRISARRDFIKKTREALRRSGVNRFSEEYEARIQEELGIFEREWAEQENSRSENKS